MQKITLQFLRTRRGRLLLSTDNIRDAHVRASSAEFLGIPGIAFLDNSLHCLRCANSGAERCGRHLSIKPLSKHDSPGDRRPAARVKSPQ